MSSIFLDVDDTINNLSRYLYIHLTSTTGLKIPFEEWTTYGVYNLYKLDKDKFHKLIVDNNLLNKPPIKEARSVINTLRKHGYFVTLISARSYLSQDGSGTINQELLNKAAEDLEAWLEKYKIMADKIIICDRSQKAYFTKKHDPVYVVEDNLQTALEIQSQTDATPILVNKPWNKTDNNMLKIDNLNELLELIL